MLAQADRKKKERIFQPSVQNNGKITNIYCLLSGIFFLYSANWCSLSAEIFREEKKI